MALSDASDGDLVHLIESMFVELCRSLATTSDAKLLSGKEVGECKSSTECDSTDTC